MEEDEWVGGVKKFVGEGQGCIMLVLYLSDVVLCCGGSVLCGA